MRRLWLIFSQAVTVGVAALFVYQVLQPMAFNGTPGVPGGAVIQMQQAAPGPAGAEAGMPPRGTGYRLAARQALPSVVHIFTSQEVRAARNLFHNDPFFRHFFGDRREMQPQRRQGLGSGVVVSADGYILTNNHVVEAADEIEVATHDGRKLKARVVGSDPDSDLAVMRVDLPKDVQLPAVVFARDETLQVGDVVLAIGNPFGVGQTVTHGIVSALGRSHLGINTFENFIQTDAAINPGNSGGALVNAEGHLVGINTAIYSQSGGSMGIGFAIPVSLARSVMEQIIQTGAVTRGWIGVEVQEITPEIAESFKLPDTQGALIAGVMKGGPADLAGVRPGDILMAVASQPVADAQGMLSLVAGQAPGSKAVLKVRRQGQSLEFAVTIARRPRPQVEPE
jgi:Do/DeqQ family serine protease